MMRLRPSYVVILVVIVLILLIAGVVLQDRKSRQTQTDRTSAAPMERSKTADPKVSGRERCRQKCSAVHKGYIYKAPHDPEASGNSHAGSELCDCI